MTIPSGTQFGPYTVLDKIGSGGMGDVYRAMDGRLQREVAIKFVADGYLVGSPGSGTPVSQQQGTPHSSAHLSHERFLREARSAAGLNHPNICGIYDTGEQDGRPYLVMELLQGATLKDVLKQGRLSATEVVTFATQAASALAAAHAKGIVHRDIKPANLFVVDAGRGKRQIKILDFGLAKKQGMEASPDSRTFDIANDATSMGETSLGETVAETQVQTQMGGVNLDLTSPGSTVGTVAYMSPEQARGSALDSRTDLFSLGSVIYEMATGKSPFSGEAGHNSTADVFAALLMKDPPPVSSVNPAMPRELDPIVAKLLAKTKEQRYASAEDLLTDLEAISPSGISSGSTATHQAASGTVSSVSQMAIAGASAADAGNRSRKRLVLVGVAALVVLAGTYSALHFKAAKTAGGAAANQAAAPTANKDSIIVADFVNKTGDPVFDTTLNQALAVQLGQSPVLTLVSQRHLRQSLQFLGKKSDEPVTPAIAREIGEREGVKAILTGTISAIGNDYLVTLTATNTATGDDIATTQATASDKNHVLDALNSASAEMRGKLGESLASIKKLNAPFGQATTPSLEAFRAYALGDSAHQRGDDIPEAEGHYKRALELDPNLAMAWARLGVIYINSGQRDRAIEYFTKAHALTANVSEREKLYIDGHYYTEVTGDTDKGIETLEEATQLYPLVLDNFINLGVAYRQAGQVDKAFDVIQKALVLAPDDAIALINVIGEYAYLDDYVDMKKYVAQAEKLGLNGTNLLGSEMMAYLQEGDSQAAQQIVARTQGRPDQFSITRFQAYFQEYSGQFQQSRASLQQATQQAAAAKAVEAEASGILGAASLTWLVGPCQDMQGAVKKALAFDKQKEKQIDAAMDLAECGDKQASPLLAELEKKYPEDTRVQNLGVPLGRALLALKDGNAQQAVDYLDRARAYDMVSPGPYLRGLAYLQLHDAPHAIEALKIATRYKGMFQITGIPPALAELALGRAYAMSGDKANAKKCYDAFFTEWKNADPDLPQIAEAKKEYAAL
jgi:serine/threonine protein kinase/tetratricopeptide (TPR) repeat protein